MSDFELREPLSTLVATKDLVERSRPPSGPDPEPRWSAARLPIVERDSYEISGEVAHGGVGRILRGRSVHLDRPVAIKELLEPGEEAAERFVCEALLTARLQHPSIVPVYDAGRWPSGELFYAMKLVSGRSLADVLADPAPTGPRLSLLPHVIAVAEAMAYAHSERIIHRDLKPANVLVGSFGETVVIDWGLAKDLADEGAPAAPAPRPGGPKAPPGDTPTRTLPAAGGLTLAGAVMGTPAYMPPEQARGASVDERADVYAIGAILYHVLSGVAPYGGGHVRAVLDAVAAGPPPPIEGRSPSLSLDLCDIVRKSMARDPGSRYPSARELAEDLTRFAAGQAVGAHRYTSGELARRFARRYRAPLLVAGAALLALSVVIGAAFHHTLIERDRAEQERRAADVARGEALRHADDLTLVQARTSASREPDRALAWLSSLSPSFDRWSAARTIAAEARTHGLAQVLRGHTESLNGLSISPDGQLVATASDDHTARIWERATGRSRVLSGHTDEVWFARFSPDGRLLATASKDRTLRLWDVATLTSRVLVHDGSVNGMSFLPDGRRLVSTSADRSVRLWDLASGEARVLGRHEAAIQAFALSRDGRLAVTGSVDGEIRVWDLETGAARVLDRSAGEPWMVAISPDGQRVASRGYSGLTLLWDLGQAGARTTLFDARGTGVPVTAVGLSFSPDGRLLAFGGEGTTLVLADAATGARRTLEGPEGRVGVLAFSPDRRWLAVASAASGPIQLWDLEAWSARSLHGFDDMVIGLSFTPDSRTLAAASYDRTARLYPVDAGDGRVLGASVPFATPISFSAFSPGGDALATADVDGGVRLWDVGGEGPSDPIAAPGHAAAVYGGTWSPDGARLATIDSQGVLVLHDCWGEPRLTLRARGDEPNGERAAVPAFSADGRRLAWSAPDRGVGVLDLDSGRVEVLSGHGASVAVLAFSGDGALLASGAYDGTARVWPLDRPGEPRVLGEPAPYPSGVVSLAFSPDGRSLATGGRDHKLRLWDLATGAARVVEAGGGGVEQLGYSPDGATLYTLSTIEAGVRVWDALTGLPRGDGMLRGREGNLHRFALSPDGTRLATAAEGHALRLWDLASGESRALQGHSAQVVDVAFSPDGRTLVSASADGSARLWHDDLPGDPAALKAWIRDALRASPATPTGVQDSAGP